MLVADLKKGNGSTLPFVANTDKQEVYYICSRKQPVLTALFTIVDDVMKGLAMIQDALKRPEPALNLTDSELVTIAVYQELIGEPRVRALFLANLGERVSCLRSIT